jgi:hypothetical protein
MYLSKQLKGFESAFRGSVAEMISLTPVWFKTFEAGVALEVFQVRSDRALLAELLRLLSCDVAGLQRALDALRRDFPAFAFGKRLPQVREIRERLHRLDAVLALELIAQRVEVELRFQVMHARLVERVAVQGAP